MNDRKPSSILDPYCPVCKEYKGIGQCTNVSCHPRSHSPSHSRIEIGLELARSCHKCDNHAEVHCSHCGRGFCEIHSKNKNSNKFEEFTQSIGTCSSCKNYVCEKCWMIEDQGLIFCLEHLESRTV